MKSKYQKYYDALKGKDFSSKVNNYKSALTNSNTKLSSAESTIGSSQWIEKGLEIIKNSVMPSLKEQGKQLDNGLNALSQATSKVSELVNQLTELEKLEKRLEELGGKWTYVEGGERTESEVNSHNSEINQQETKISNQESTIDSTIAAINGIQFTYSSPATSFKTIMKDLKDNTDLEARKRAFIGSIDDDCYYTDPNYAKQARALRLFDNATGKELKEGDTITVKKGERRVITVKLPIDGGHIKEIVRTSAWKPKGCTVLNTYSDLDPDPNNIEYVNFHYNHYPKDKSLLHQNYYEWVIDGTREGSVQISQTCLYSREEGGPCPKAMVDIHVNVVS